MKGKYETITIKPETRISFPLYFLFWEKKENLRGLFE